VRSIFQSCGLVAVVIVLTGCPAPTETERDGGSRPTEVFDSGFVHILPSDWRAQPVAAVPHGPSLMVVGTAVSDGGSASILVAKVRADRTLDPSWNGTGVSLTEVAPGSSPLFSNSGGYAALMDGDRLLVAGAAQAFFTPGEGFQVFVARYLSTGQLDTTFGNSSGLRLDAFGDMNPVTAAATAIVKQPDGKILVGGQVQENFFVTRYLENGAPDVSFSKTPGSGFGAVWGTSRTELTRSMVLDPDGKIVVFGGDSMSAARLTATGDLDRSFGTDGYWSSPGATGSRLWRENNGSYLAVGFRRVTTDGGASQLAVRFARLTSSGQPDATFGTMGIQDVTLPGANLGFSTIRGAARLSDGRVLLYLAALGANRLVRFNADLTLDQGFLEAGLPKEVPIELPLFQPAFLFGQLLSVAADDRWWVTDINLVVVDPKAPRSASFLDVRTGQ
jgi:uncharacterized delta-60 repeat protein